MAMRLNVLMPKHLDIIYMLPRCWMNVLNIWTSYLCVLTFGNLIYVTCVMKITVWTVDIVRKVFFLCVDLLCDRINMFSCECAYFFWRDDSNRKIIFLSVWLIVLCGFTHRTTFVNLSNSLFLCVSNCQKNIFLRVYRHAQNNIFLTVYVFFCVF
jgi:hypothetical protein